MSDLRSQLQSITDSFVSAVLAAMKSASLGDLATEARPARGPAPKARTKTTAKKVAKSGAKKVAKPAPKAVPAAKEPASPAAKRPRAAAKTSSVKLAVVKDHVLAYVKAHANERSEKVRAALKLDRPVYLRAVAELLEAKKMTKKGDRRKTSFTAVA